MYGLALEGGGAKGAFHLGAMKAFCDEGYEFGGVTGTSIGALNGAIIAQGDFEAGYTLWEGMKNALLYDIEDTYYQRLLNREIDRETLVNLAVQIKNVIENRGFDTSRMRQMIESIVNEERLRASPVDFGLVTVSVTDLKPLELFKEDIPRGKLIDYLMASAHFPGLKFKTSDNKRYIDGGFYDNCPVNLLVKKGYRRIYAIRTHGPGFVRPVRRPDVMITDILPSEDLGRVLDFDNSVIKRNLKMGYYDVLRTLKGLRGCRYYVRPENEYELANRLMNLPEDGVLRLARLYGARNGNPMRLLFESVLPKAAMFLGLPAHATYQDVTVGLLEILAQEKELDRFRIYTLEEFIGLTGGLSAPETELPYAGDAVLRIKGSLLKKQLLRSTGVRLRALLAGAPDN